MWERLVIHRIQIICLDLQSGEEKDIYHTDNRIVGIIIR